MTFCGATLLLLLTFAMGSYAVYEANPVSCLALQATGDAIACTVQMSLLFAFGLIAASIAALVPAATARRTLRGWMVTVQGGCLAGSIVLTVLGVVLGYIVLHRVTSGGLERFSATLEQVCRGH